MKQFILVLSLFVASTSVFAESEKVSRTTSPNLVSMAWVDQVQTIEVGNGRVVKIHSYSGDSAMNGLYVMLSVYNDETRDFNVYQLANTTNYKILPSKKNGFLKLALISDTMSLGGEIVEYKSTLYVNLLNSHQTDGAIEIEEVK